MSKNKVRMLRQAQHERKKSHFSTPFALSLSKGTNTYQKRNFPMMIINENKLNSMWTIARYVYGLVPIVIGADKFFSFIVDWNIYVSPFAASVIPIMHLVPIVGIIEIAAGLLILTKYPRFGAYLVAAWLGLIIVNLFMIGGLYDIILRDIAIAFGYIMFGLLTDLKKTAQPQ